MFRIVHASLFAALCTLLAAPAAAADGYPDRPIRLIAGFPPGGGVDINARLLADPLGQALGQTVVVDNRPGAGGRLGTELVAKASPDGYTLGIAGIGMAISRAIYKNLPYDTLRDFIPISLLTEQPNILVANPSIPAKSFEDFIALARSQPGKLSYGSPGVDTGTHLATVLLLNSQPVLSVRELIALARQRPGEIRYASAGRGSNIFMTTELFKHMAKIDLLQVPYKGGGPAAVGLMSGETQVLITGIMGAMPHMRSGRMRGLAVTTKQRSPVLPDLPTIDESGVPGYDKAGWFGLFAPAAVPAPVIDYVYQAMAKVLKDPATVKRLATDGATAVGNSPAEFDAFVRAEIAEWGKLIREMML